MSKTIKVDDEVYSRLEQFRAKRETFSEAVARLLTVTGKVEDLAPLIYHAEIKSPREVNHDH